MKKMSLVFAGSAVLAMASLATAGTINLYFVASCPDPTGFNVTPGNAIVRLAPSSDAVQSHFSDGSAFLYMDVGCRGDGVGNEIVSSLGLNIRKAATAGAVALTATGFTVNTTGTGAVAGPWSAPSPNTPTLNAAGNLLVQNSRAVAVPSSTTDALWSGYTPNRGSGATTCGAGGVASFGTGGTGHYRVGRLALHAGTVAAGQGRTTYDLFMQVGALKITRVYDPTATNGGAPENVSFGYNGASPDATTNGSAPGAESGLADASVIIRKKGDFGSVDQNSGDFCTGVPDGAVDGDDLNYFFNRQGGSLSTCNGNPDALSAAEYTWIGDFGSVNQNTGDFCAVPDCAADGDDLNAMFNYVNGQPVYGAGC